METNYIKNLNDKKKSAKKFGLALLILAVIFVVVLYKFAHNSSVGFTGTGLPSNNDVYIVAKRFITNIKPAVNFPETGYEIAKRRDSVFVIRTVVDFPAGSYNKRKTRFRLIMKYNGGLQSHLESWSLLKIDEENN